MSEKKGIVLNKRNKGYKRHNKRHGQERTTDDDIYANDNNKTRTGRPFSCSFAEARKSL